MIRRFTQRQALNSMIGIMICVIVFHVLVLIQVIPYTIVWAGKINSTKQMIAFELVSIAINVFLMLVLLLKGNYIRNNFPRRILNFVIWFFVIVFALNTVGNLFAETKFELYVFTTLTFISAVLCLRIVMEEKITARQE